MAEQPVTGKQLVKALKPSRLRNEICPDSIDDEKSPDKDHIQVPHSDTVVPETQLDSVAHSGTDDDFDKVSQALIRRNRANKDLKASPPSPTQFKMLSRERFGSGTMELSSSIPAFSFGQARKVPGKTNLNIVPQVTTKATIADGVEQGRGQSLNVSGADATPEARPRPEKQWYGNNETSNPATIQRTGALPRAFQATDASRREPDAKGSKLPQSSSSIPPSAQPRPIDVTKKTRIVKGRHKGKKSTLSHRRSDVWLPRLSLDEGKYNHAPINFPLRPPAKQSDVQTSFITEEDGKPSPTAPEHFSDTQNSSISASQALINRESQREMETFTIVHCKPESVTSKVKVGSSQSAIPAQSSAVSNEQPLTAVPKPTFQAILGGPTALALECAPQSSFERGSMESPETSRDFSQQINETPKGASTSAEQVSHLPRDSDVVNASTPPCKEGNIGLNKTANQDNSHQVSKPRKRIQAPDGLMTHHNHGSSITVNFDRTLDQIRTVYHAEKLRAQHELKQTATHHEETITALRDLISLQKKNIAELEDKHRDLRDSLIRLTDKAKTNQKYVTGLQNDYEKLQKSAITHHDQTKKILQEKIREVEHENESLQKEFESTLIVLNKGQKNLRATVEDLYARLVLSNSNKRDLSENLSKQTALYKAECEKREDLQKQLFSFVQTMHSRLGEISTALLDKIKNVESSIDNVATKNDADPRIQECLKILQSVQATPVLTVKDVAKVEGMLRFVHERFDAGVEALKIDVENKKFPTDEIQTFIKSQLDILRADQLKYNEVVSENLRAGEANKTLRTQLLAQEKVSHDLEGSIKEFRQKEIDLKTRLSQLENEMSELRVTSQVHEAQPSGLEQKTLELRRRAENAEGGLAAAQSKSEQVDQLRRQIAEELAKYKKMYDACKAKLLEIGKQIESHQKSTESIAEMRMKLAKEYQKEFKEKESEFKNEIHRITVERDDNDGKYQEQLQQAKAAKNQMHDLRNNVKAITVELQTMRGERDELQAKLKNAQQNAEANTRGASEIASLKGRLQQKVEEINSMKQEYATIDREHADLRDKTAGLQNSYDQSKAQVAQHLSTIDALHKESATQLSEATRKNQITVHTAQDQASALRKEKDALVSELEQGRSIRTKLEAAQNCTSKERDGLKQQVVKLQVDKDDQDAELVRVRASVAEEREILVEGHRREVEVWRLRFENSHTALKQVEAQVRRMEAEHRASLESIKKETESRFQLVARETESAIQKAKLEGVQSQQQILGSLPDVGTSARSLQSSFGGNKKIVNRQNQSVLNALGSVRTQFDTARHTLAWNQLDLPQDLRQDSELSTNLFEEDRRHGFESAGLVDGNDFSLVKPAAENVSETQLTTGPAMNLENFDEAKSRGGSSTDLSVMCSEDLTRLEVYTHDASTPMLRGRDLNFLNIASEQKHRRKNSMQTDDMAIADSQSSQSGDRPRSRANTASRMMPPPEFVDHHPKRRNPSVKDNATNGAARPTFHENPSQKRCGQASSSGASSPDFIISKHTYLDSRRLARDQSHVASRSSENSHNRKRKSSISLNDLETALKKHRTASHHPKYTRSDTSDEVLQPSGPRSRTNSNVAQAGISSGGLHSRTQPGSANIPPRKSGQGMSSSDVSQSRAQNSSSPDSQVVGRARRSSSRLMKSRKGRGGDGAYDDRFSQELSRR